MAIGAGTFTAVGGAVSDLFAAKGHDYKSQGHRLEAQNYREAAAFAEKNAEYTKHSYAIKQMQMDRTIAGTLGGIRSDVAGAGLASSGSSLDILRDNAQQGAITKAVLQEQGLITEAGYHEQARSYRVQADAADLAADAENEAAKGSKWSSYMKFGAAAVSVAPGVPDFGGGGGDYPTDPGEPGKPPATGAGEW